MEHIGISGIKKCWWNFCIYYFTTGSSRNGRIPRSILSHSAWDSVSNLSLLHLLIILSLSTCSSWDSLASLSLWLALILSSLACCSSWYSLSSLSLWLWLMLISLTSCCSSKKKKIFCSIWNAISVVLHLPFFLSLWLSYPDLSFNIFSAFPAAVLEAVLRYILGHGRHMNKPKPLPHT